MEKGILEFPLMCCGAKKLVLWAEDVAVEALEVVALLAWTMFVFVKNQYYEKTKNVNHLKLYWEVEVEEATLLLIFG